MSQPLTFTVELNTNGYAFQYEQNVPNDIFDGKSTLRSTECVHLKHGKRSIVYPLQSTSSDSVILQFIRPILFVIIAMDTPSTDISGNFQNWNSDQIVNWICSLENGRFAKYRDGLRAGFRAEGVNGSHLRHFGKWDLRNWGVQSFDDRVIIEQHIKLLVTSNVPSGRVSVGRRHNIPCVQTRKNRKDLIGKLSDEWWSNANSAEKWKSKYECMREVCEILTGKDETNVEIKDDIADHMKSGDFIDILVKWMSVENHVPTRIAIFRLMPKLIEAFPAEILNKDVPKILDTILTKQWMEKKAALLQLVTPTLISLWLKVRTLPPSIHSVYISLRFIYGTYTLHQIRPNSNSIPRNLNPIF